MTVGFVISAHKRPDMLLRIVDALEGRPCAIHIDRKASYDASVLDDLSQRRNVTLLPRHLCRWGDFGHAKATLKGLRWFLETECKHVVVMTGQCYPLRRVADIEAELARLQGASIIRAFPLPQARWEGGGLNRVERFYFTLPGSQRNFWVKLWSRRPPLGLKLHGGSSYFCLSRERVDYIVSMLDAHPNIERFFSHTFIADEMFFQTLIGSDPDQSDIINDNLHYIEWDDFAPHPRIISDPEPAMSSGKWFARKFEDLAALDLIDAKLSRPISASGSQTGRRNGSATPAG